MATASKSYSFVSGDYARSAEVNQNFDDIIAFLNGSVIHKDGTVAFTGAPSYAADPASGNVLTRKSYVETNAITPLTNRLKVVDVATPLVTSKPTVTATQFTVQGGTGTVGANTVSQAVTFPTAFPNGVVSVVASIGDSTGVTALQVNGYLKTGFTVNGYSLLTAFDGSQYFGALAGTWRYNWIAIGW
jgi:hypothetical protein